MAFAGDVAGTDVGEIVNAADVAAEAPVDAGSDSEAIRRCDCSYCS